VGTRRLTLLRHGKAQSIDACAEDFERTLTRRGCIEAREMAMRIVHRDLIPDLILVSPAERAWATAEIIAEACELDAKQMQCARELYLGTPEATWRLLARCDDRLGHIMICGHNPGLSQIASRLGPTPSPRELSTAGIASAVWYNARWEALLPETAVGCELDDPESMDDL
jgi:phosphohistidine phosphatase